MQSTSKAKLRQYQQLNSKKFRQKYGVFVVEGLKSVNELAQSSWPVDCILCTKDFLEKNPGDLGFETEVVSDEVFAKISGLKNPQHILAIAKVQELKLVPSNWKIALDDVRDPGNLGTIIRIADWYGINTIYCSKNSVDVFNSKVIQASMGSFLRVSVKYINLAEQLQSETVFSTLLEGQSIREITSDGGVLLIGNEANGISTEVLNAIETTAITIPGNGHTESLNAAIATAICCERLMG